MKTIEYSEDGIAFADAQAESKVREFLSSEADYISVSTENFILATRCMVYEKHFPYDQVVFLFKGQTLHLDKDGRLPVYPSAFCKHTEDFLFRLLARR